MTISSPQQDSGPSDSGGQQESCRACLFTGVGTCLGLSTYFMYLATEEEEGTMKQQQTHQKYDKINRNNHHTATHQSTKANGINVCSKKIPKTQSKNAFQTSLMKFMQGSPSPKRNKPFLFAFSAFWAAAGAYRLYLN